MKGLVTGSSGFIGKHLVARLVQDGWEVDGLDNFAAGSGVPDGLANFYPLDVAEEGFTGANYDVVFHLAAQARIYPSFKKRTETMRTNVLGTDMMLRVPTKKFVFTSSSSIYADTGLPLKESDRWLPKSPYSVSKTLAELLIAYTSSNYSICRLFNVYGPGQAEEGDNGTVIGRWLKAAREGKPLIVHGDGSRKRDFTYIDDIVDGLVKAADYPNSGVFNLGSGANHTLLEIAQAISPNIELVDDIPGQTHDRLANYSFAKVELGWQPKTSIIDYLRLLTDQKKCYDRD